MRASIPRLVALVAALIAASLLLVPRAEAYIYWDGLGIGRAELDGSNLVTDFVTPGSRCGIATDGSHLYWSRNLGGPPPNFIGRANLPDGTGADPTFITVPQSPRAVAVDAAHVYWIWTSSDASGGSGAIGRADLDGSNADQNFIPTGDPPGGLAVHGAHIYWTVGDGDSDGDPYTDHNWTIGRADLDGSNVDPDFLDPLTTFPQGLAVDGTHIFWTATAGFPGSRIGRANLDGTGIDESFITGARDPWGLAVDETRIYWANAVDLYNSTIGRANLDGSNVDQNFIPGSLDPSYFYACGLAVDPLSTAPAPSASLPPPSKDFSLGKVKKNKQAGTARLTVSVPAPGELELAKTKKVKADQETAEAAGAEKLILKPRRGVKSKLSSDGQAKVKATVTYAPEGATPSTESKTVELIKR
jgi:hypothetical protein